MKHALNATDIKRANQRLVLDAIFQAGTTSRTQLARELHMSKPAISDNLQPLLDLGIVAESGVGSAGPSGGRKSILLQFNPKHRLIVAVNMNFSNPVFALADLSGDVINAFDITISRETPLENCADLICNGIRMLLQSLGTEARNVFCIAVAAPGVFDREGKLVAYSTSCGGPAWWQVDLKKTLTEAFDLPVIVHNDVKAAALGEWMRGAGDREENLLHLHVGLGIGCGIILGGQLLIGEHFSAGEIYDHYDMANAHKGGKLEDTLCIGYLKEQCLQVKDSPFALQTDIMLEDILQAYSEGNEPVTAVVEDICRRLAVLSHNYMSFLSVNRIVFGGDYVPFGACFARHLRDLFASSLWPEPDIRISVLGKYAGIQGMVVLAREQYFREICGNA